MRRSFERVAHLARISRREIGVWRATLIQGTRHLDSIVTRAMLVAEFFNSIDPKRTLCRHFEVPKFRRDLDPLDLEILEGAFGDLFAHGAGVCPA